MKLNIYRSESRVEWIKRLKFPAQINKYSDFAVRDSKLRCDYVLRMFSGVKDRETGMSEDN